jgi:uncharacterized protein DUF378
MKKLDVIAAVLLVIGGLNWALVGVARFDLVATIFGMHFGETAVERRTRPRTRPLRRSTGENGWPVVLPLQVLAARQSIPRRTGRR